MKKAITIRNLNKSINGKKILSNINLDIYEGQIVGLVGKNGAGKSTLLKILSGLYKYEDGEIFIFENNFKLDYERCMKEIGSLIEAADLYKNLSGKENLKIFKSMFKGINKNRINEVVKIVEMEKTINKKFKNYSLGMKERLAIACALINKPKILILDEPTNGLDPLGVKKIIEMLKNMENTTIIISSHMLNEIESICDKIVFINDGKIINIKNKEEDDSKKRVLFEVDDYLKAKVLMKEYLVSENLEVYESDETVSFINKELIFNNINVYRIHENKNNLEKEFFDMVNSND